MKELACLASALIAPLVAVSSANQVGRDSEIPPATVFTNVRAFDGEQIIPSTAVLVEDGVIAQIGAKIEAPPGAEVVDAAGMTLLPGLIDCHTHTFSELHLERAAVFGVTTVLDMFTEPAFAARMRSEQAAGPAEGRADLLSAGVLVTAPGGHGTQFGIPIPTITAPEQAQEFVDARIEEGSDYIKLVYDDGKVWGMGWPTLDQKTMAAVVRAAHEREKMAVAHVSTRQAALEAFESGVDGLVHICADEPGGDALVASALEQRAFVIPTLTVLESAGGTASGAALAEDEGLAPFIAPDVVQNLNTTFPGAEASPANYPAARETVRNLHAAGVPILAGSDAPNPGTAQGVSLHRELELLVAAGLTPVEALTAATSLPAQKFGLSDRGRLAPGLRADLVLVKGDPSSDILATRSIVAVWKAGRRIDRDALRERVTLQTQEAAAGGNAPPGSESGLVSDFEGEAVATVFGSGWTVSTDSFVGGKSTAEFELASGGADESGGSLLVTGTVDDKPQPRWAGVAFMPGPAPMTPADLSAKKSITFWVKGDAQPCTIMLFFQKRAFQPSFKGFVTVSEWTQHSFEIADFDGCDGSDITSLFFGCGAETGDFEFQLDDVRFE